MILNNIEKDIKIKCLEADMTQRELGDAIDSTGQYVNRVIKKNSKLVNDTFIRIMEALGYDIRLEYVKRG